MQLIDLATFSRKHFFFFVKKCNEVYRSGHDLIFYKKIIEMHREINDLRTLIKEDVFLHTIYSTLEKWNMNQRGARLVSFQLFKKSLEYWNNLLIELYKYKLYQDIDSEITTINKIIEKAFCNLKVMESKRKIIGVSKTLHFLLPDLIMPIDSKYTMPAFYGYNRYSSSPKVEFQTFKEIFEISFEKAEKLQLKQSDVDGFQWNTSVPKLIDNAIIGLSKSSEKEVMALFDES